MKIGGESIQNILVNMVLEKKKKFKRHKFEKTCFHASSFGNGLNKFLFGTIQSMELKSILPRFVLRIHHH
jgi:hypothetical protein